jgi:hypothetical protein
MELGVPIAEGQIWSAFRICPVAIATPGRFSSAGIDWPPVCHSRGTNRRLFALQLVRSVSAGAFSIYTKMCQFASCP